MPWYWTDDLARHLLDNGRISPDRAEMIARTPVAIRSEEEDIDRAAGEVLDEDESPLAA